MSYYVLFLILSYCHSCSGYTQVLGHRPPNSLHELFDLRPQPRGLSLVPLRGVVLRHVAAPLARFARFTRSQCLAVGLPSRLRCGLKPLKAIQKPLKAFKRAVRLGRFRCIESHGWAFSSSLALSDSFGLSPFSWPHTAL